MNDYKLGLKVLDLLIPQPNGAGMYLIRSDSEFAVARLIGLKVSDHWPSSSHPPSNFEESQKLEQACHDRDKRAIMMLGSRARNRTLNTENVEPELLIKLTALLVGVPTPTESRAIRRRNWIGQIETGMAVTMWLESLETGTNRKPAWQIDMPRQDWGFCHYMGNPEKFDGKSYITGTVIQYEQWKKSRHSQTPECCSPRAMARIGRWFSSGRLNVLHDELGIKPEQALKLSAFYAEYKTNGKRFDARLLPDRTVLRAAPGAGNQQGSRPRPKCST